MPYTAIDTLGNEDTLTLKAEDAMPYTAIDTLGMGTL
jgi:hypothetical protein